MKHSPLLPAIGRAPFVRIGVALIALVSASIALGPVRALAEVEFRFTAPPYEVGKTVVGMEGWEMRHKPPHPVHTDPEGARLIDSLVLNPQQVTTLELRTFIVNRQIADLKGSFTLDVNFASAHAQRSDINEQEVFVVSFGHAGEAASFYFGIDCGSSGGLFYKGEGAKVVILEMEQFKRSALYRFQVHVDTDMRTFRVEVTGQRANDEPFEFTSDEIGFQETFHPATLRQGLFVQNRRPAGGSVYIDSIVIQPR